MSSYNWSLNGLPLQSGPRTVGDGNSSQLRGARDGSTVTRDGGGRYTEQTFRGNIFACANSAAQALSLTGTTTYTGMVVYNPSSSGKNLCLLEAMFCPTTSITATGAIILFSQAIAAATPTLTTTNVSTSPFSTILTGATNSVAKVASACTLAANPIFLRPLASQQFSGTAATINLVPSLKDEIGGALIVPPGAGVGIVAVTTAITGLGYISWEELPL